MPTGGALVGGGQRQHARFGESRAGDHQSHRQAGRGETAGHRNRGDAVHVELRGIFELRIPRLIAFFALDGGIDLAGRPAPGGLEGCRLSCS